MRSKGMGEERSKRMDAPKPLLELRGNWKARMKTSKRGLHADQRRTVSRSVLNQ